MNTYEQLLYIVRLFVILISALLLVVIIQLSTYDVGSTTHYHVDNHIATVLYSAEFWQKPGVIDKQLFTQESMNEMYDLRSESINFFVDFTLQEAEQNTTISLHEQEKSRLAPFAQAGTRGIYTEKNTFPVSLSTGEAALLVVEAYYES